MSDEIKPLSAEWFAEGTRQKIPLFLTKDSGEEIQIGEVWINCETADFQRQAHVISITPMDLRALVNKCIRGEI